MRKQDRAPRLLADIDPSWRAMIEQRVAVNRHWRHTRRDLRVTGYLGREFTRTRGVFELPG